MKEFVIFVFLLATLSPGDTRKVCILYEQTAAPTTTIVNDEVSVTINEELAVTEEDIVITLGDASEVIEDETQASPVAVTELVVPSTSNVTESTANVCALEAITLFDDQNDLLRKLCAIKPGSSPLYVVTVQNSIVKTDLSLTTLCTEGARGLLSWISWQDFIEKVKPFLSVDEIPALVVRNLSIWNTYEPPSESDGKSDPFSEVLIEMLPIRYKLVNMTPSAWTNNTFIKTVTLGSVELENAENEAQHAVGEVKYSFPVQTNITFLSSYPISGLPVEMSDERKNFVVGSEASYLFEETFSVERLVPASKRETVSLTGTYGIHEYDIEGKIVSIFGLNADGSTIEESHTIRARVVSTQTYDIKDTYNLEDFTTTTVATTTEETEAPTEEPISLPFSDEQVYPGFRKVFYVALFLFFGTVSVAAIDIVRKLRKDQKAKKHGRRTYEKIVPKF